MNRSELIAHVAQSFSGLRYTQIQKAVSGIFKGIIHSVNEGNRVELRGFGVFFVSYRKPKLGRNPKTGEAVAIPARRKISFRAGRNLKEKMNHPSLEGKKLQADQKKPHYWAGKGR